MGTIVLSPDGGSTTMQPPCLMVSFAILSVESIETHIAKDREELAKAEASGDEAKVRHYATELEGLETYLSRHPGEHKDPTSLEVHCDLNPDAPECRVYDD